MRSRSGRRSFAARTFARFQSVRGNHRLTFNSPFAERSMRRLSYLKGSTSGNLLLPVRGDEPLKAPGRVANHSLGELHHEGQFRPPPQPVACDAEPLGGLIDGEKAVLPSAVGFSFGSREPRREHGL